MAHVRCVPCEKVMCLKVRSQKPTLILFFKKNIAIRYSIQARLFTTTTTNQPSISAAIFCAIHLPHLLHTFLKDIMF